MSCSTTLADLCDIQSGGTPSRAVGEFYDGTIPWAKIRDLEVANGLLLNTEESITELGLKAIKGRLFPAGTLLFAIYGSIGKMAFAGREVSCNQAILGIQNRSNGVLNDRYLYHWLASRQKVFLDAGQGIAQKNLSAGYLRSLQIPLPSPDEQKRVAAILDKADQLRQKRRQAIALLDSLTQSIFLEMFGDPMSNPRGWPLSALGPLQRVGPNFGSMQPPSKELREWISLRVANIQNWEITLEDTKYIDLDEKEIERFTLKDGDIVLARAIASQEHLGKCVVVNVGAAKIAFDSHLMRIRLDQEKILPEFLRELFRTPGGRTIFLKSTRKTTVQYNINTKELNQIRIPLPPLVAQRQFMERLISVTATRMKMREAMRQEFDLFSSLQHRAFSGQL